MGFDELVEKDIFACLICAPSTQNLSAREKKDKKRLLRYTSASWSTSLRRHVHDHHSKEHANFKKRLAERGMELMGERVPKKARNASTLQGVFALQKKSSDNSISQLCFNRDIILMIATSALPLSIVDNRYFQTAILQNNPNNKIPSRYSLCDVLIPNFIKDFFTRYVTPKLISMDTVAISLDLWMSRGCQDIFHLIVHRIDANFKRHQVHLCMLECGSTRGLDLATVLKPELEKHNPLHKLSACVKDSGSNPGTCTRTTTDCRPLCLEECFEGICFAHILSVACSGALKAIVDSEIRHISSGKAIGELQSCIRSMKKSGKGREAWFSSFFSRGKAQCKIPTPVKTRFASSVVMMSMMLVYRDVVEHCFSNQVSIELRNRVPSINTWEIIGTIVTVLEPVMQAVYQSQSGEWL